MSSLADALEYWAMVLREGSIDKEYQLLDTKQDGEVAFASYMSCTIMDRYLELSRKFDTENDHEWKKDKAEFGKVDDKFAGDNKQGDKGDRIRVTCYDCDANFVADISRLEELKQCKECSRWGVVISSTLTGELLHEPMAPKYTDETGVAEEEEPQEDPKRKAIIDRCQGQKPYMARHRGDDPACELCFRAIKRGELTVRLSPRPGNKSSTKVVHNRCIAYEW